MSNDETTRLVAQITGTPQPGTFERACYAARNHGDGTGTVVLDWYEARQVVALLNEQLPRRALSAPTEFDWSDDLPDG